MSSVGSCPDNALDEGFCGMLKREQVNRRCYSTWTEARSDLFDYIELFHSPRMPRKLQGMGIQKIELNSTARTIRT